MSAPVDVSALLADWVAKGLITEEQATRIRAEVSGGIPTIAAVPSEPSVRQPSLVTEALGYLGGVLILVAAGLLAAQYWADLALGVRLGIVAAAAGLLLAAGVAVPRQLGPVGARLRAVLWLLSTGAIAAFLALLVSDGLDWQDETVALVAGAGTAAYAGALWRWHRNILQQLAVFIALAVTAGAAVAQLPDADESLSGLAIWGLAVVWVALGWGGVIAPRRAAYLIGGVGALFGAAATMMTDWGYALGLGTAAGVVGLAVLLGDLVLLAIGAIGMLQFLPVAVSTWFPGAVAAPLALLAVGLVLVAAAVYTTRRRRPHASTGRRESVARPTATNHED